ncbi:MAG TPA: TPM domain-containing protein [Ktedonobacteraceae bacterium]|jgi:uncharacterized membrane protein YgcG
MCSHKQRIQATGCNVAPAKTPHALRNRLRRFSVFLLLLWGLFSACAGQLPAADPAGNATQDPPLPQLTRATRGILDTSRTVPADFLEQLRTLSDEVQAQGYQIAVIFFNNLASDPHQFATEVFNTNGIGFQDKDNGVLLVLYLQRPGSDGHPPWLSYITGAGIAGALPDTLMDEYVQITFVPARAQGNWQQGLLTFYQKIFAAELDPTIASQWQVQHGQSSFQNDPSGQMGGAFASLGIVLLGCLAVIIWLLVSAVVASRRRENFFLTALRLLGRLLILLVLLNRSRGSGPSSARGWGGTRPWGGGGRSPSSGGDV